VGNCSTKLPSIPKVHDFSEKIIDNWIERWKARKTLSDREFFFNSGFFEKNIKFKRH